MIYLDNAATSFPKPPEVIAEITRCMTEYCGNPGRGSHKLALASAEKIYDCRVALCNLFSADAPEDVVFTQNATHALNIAILSLAREGAHFICSDCEHNSVRRPLEYLARERGCSYSVFNSHVNDPFRSPQKLCRSIVSLIRPETVAVISTACPNVCSARMPLAEIGALCKKANLYFIVDGAQGAGHFEINMKTSSISALAIPGHKGLLGPQGSGALILSKDFPARSLTYGGSGTASLDADMPAELPERLEAGTLPTPAAAALCAGIREVKALTLEEIFFREERLSERLLQGLSVIKGVTVYGGQYGGGTVLFNLKGKSSEEVSELLDRYGICVRGGYHCCPLGHKALGTSEGGVRASFSPFNTFAEVDRMLFALNKISRQ